MKVLLMYPPGDLFQRGEERCQSNIKTSSATSMRACNDLGYAAAVLLKNNHLALIRDYATEEKSIDDLYSDIKDFCPDVILISTTNATVFYDIGIINDIKKNTSFSGKVILKGAIFFDAEMNMLKSLDLTNVDVLSGGEIEFEINDIIEAFKNNKFESINNIFYKDKKSNFKKNSFIIPQVDLNELPFPARNLMNNDLYVRPDTGETMATIQTARGCPSNCIYCLSPKISGKKVRFRTPENVLDELIECYEKYNISNFFFKADTFTIDLEWTSKLCDLIIKSHLYKKIQFTANSRVKPISEEVISKMKEAGCFTIAFGFESGDEDTIKRIQKGVTLEDNYNAMRICKKYKLPVFGFYMIGFPWDTKETIKRTKKAIFKLNADFIELHIALPYYGTKLYDICKEENTLQENVLGSDYFNASTTGTKELTYNELIKMRKRILLLYYIRPKYVIKKIWNAKKDFRIIKNYFRFGFKLLKNM